MGKFSGDRTRFFWDSPPKNGGFISSETQGMSWNNYLQIIPGWWFGCHEFYFPINIGLHSSSQLTDHIFSEGWPNHQIRSHPETWGERGDFFCCLQNGQVHAQHMEACSWEHLPGKTLLIYMLDILY